MSNIENTLALCNSAQIALEYYFLNAELPMAFSSAGHKCTYLVKAAKIISGPLLRARSPLGIPSHDW